MCCCWKKQRSPPASWEVYGGSQAAWDHMAAVVPVPVVPVLAVPGSVGQQLQAKLDLRLSSEFPTRAGPDSTQPGPSRGSKGDTSLLSHPRG